MTDPVVRHVQPEGLHKAVGYSHVVEASGGKMVFIAGQVAWDKDGNIVGEGDMARQAEQVFENLKGALSAVGGDLSHLVKIVVYFTDISQLAAVREVRTRYLGADNPPASTGVQVTALVRPELLIEIDAIAVVPS
jgi:enamine deaminase RidA (YjgF/YER057c/UK114 family)